MSGAKARPKASLPPSLRPAVRPSLPLLLVWRGGLERACVVARGNGGGGNKGHGAQICVDSVCRLLGGVRRETGVRREGG